MKIKKYTAKDMQQAMIKIKNELGSNAIILHTKKVKKGGFLGLFRKKMIEITAASDFDLDVSSEKFNQNKRDFNKVYRKSNVDVKKQSNSIKKSRESEKNYYTNNNKKVVSNQEAQSNTVEELKKEVRELKKMIEDINSNNIFAKESKREANQNLLNGNRSSEAINDVYNKLIKNEVTPHIASRLIERVADNLNGKQIKDKNTIETSIKKEISEKIKDTIKKDKHDKKKEIMAFIGPTGVGKTTTIAKLAANFALYNNKKVGLITTDTYRIAAIEQLKTYAEILEVPLEIVYNSEDLLKSVQKYKDIDTILIDTAGNSPNNKMQINELKNLFEKIDLTDVVIVLSATTRSNDLYRIIDSYSEIKINRLLFTKLDETSIYGSLLNVIDYTKYPLSFVTIGQSVPEDIERVNPDKLASLILGEYAYERSGR